MSSGFAGVLFSRLDAIHQQGPAPAPSGTGTGGDNMMGLGYGGGSRARQVAPASALTVYSMGTLLGGNRSESPGQTGFSYDGTSGTVGLEYSVDRKLIMGLAGNYTATGADLNGGATTDVEALQAAAYLSYATRHWFADAVAAVGHHELDLARPGVTDTISGSTDATTIALAARTAYLFDLGILRAGPIAGLTYIHSRVGSYTEKGDPALTVSVSAQTLDTLTGSVGIRFLAPFMSGGNIVAPFLNVTLEHQFGDNTQTVAASLTQAPLVPILAPIPNFDTRTYGKVDGGVTFGLGPNVSATVNAASTFARDEGNDYRISAGFNYRF